MAHKYILNITSELKNHQELEPFVNNETQLLHLSIKDIDGVVTCFFSMTFDDWEALKKHVNSLIERRVAKNANEEVRMFIQNHNHE